MIVITRLCNVACALFAAAGVGFLLMPISPTVAWVVVAIMAMAFSTFLVVSLVLLERQRRMGLF